MGLAVPLIWWQYKKTCTFVLVSSLFGSAFVTEMVLENSDVLQIVKLKIIWKFIKSILTTNL